MLFLELSLNFALGERAASLRVCHSFEEQHIRIRFVSIVGVCYAKCSPVLEDFGSSNFGKME